MIQRTKKNIIYEHPKGSEPMLRHNYCTDDSRLSFHCRGAKYRVFQLDLPQNKHLLGRQKCTFKSKNWNLYIHEKWNFELWPLDFVENNIPVLHSLSPEWWQIFTWNSIILFRNIFISKYQNKVILAISILILRTWVAFKTSVALMTSTDMMTLLASMTSTASLASKNQKLLGL